MARGGKDGGALPWLLLGLGGALALAFTQRKTIMEYGAKALQAGNELLFQAALPSRAQDYSDVILRVAREQGVDPFLIFAIGDRETLWGTSPSLDQQGPGGRGDSGHGYGLMQIDDRSNAAWLAANDWTDPYTNVTKGVLIWKKKQAFLATTVPVPGLTDGVTVTINAAAAKKRGISAGSYPDPRPLTGSALVEAAVAAYNTGEGNVLMSLAAGLPAEATSAGGDYWTDVADRLATAVAAFTGSPA